MRPNGDTYRNILRCALTVCSKDKTKVAFLFGTTAAREHAFIQLTHVFSPINDFVRMHRPNFLAELENGSSIRFVTTGNADQLRGLVYDEVYIDGSVDSRTSSRDMHYLLSSLRSK